VRFLEQVPVTFKAHFSKDKKSVTLDTQILVLSSQFENSLFTIKFSAEKKADPENFSECHSSPIKVVSKPTQLQAKAKKRTRTRSTPTKDMFVDAMEKLDKGQERHTHLLSVLLQQSQQQTDLLRVLLEDEMRISSPYHESDSERSPKRVKKEPVEEFCINSSPSSQDSAVEVQREKEFSLAFQNLINAYNNSLTNDSPNFSSFKSEPNLNSSVEDINSVWPQYNNNHQNFVPQEIEQYSFSPSSDNQEDPLLEEMMRQPVLLNPSDIFGSHDLSHLPNLFDLSSI